MDDVLLVFNELSVSPSAVEGDVALRQFMGFVSAARQCRRLGRRVALHSHSGINGLTFGDGRSFAQLRNHIGVEERQYLKLLADRFPFTAAFGGDERRLNELEYYWSNGEQSAPSRAFGLGVAHAINGFAISLRSEHHWENLRIAIALRTLDSDSKIKDVGCEVKNVFEGFNPRDHIGRLIEERSWSGPEIWEARSILFSALSFIKRVRPQIESLLPGTEETSSVLSRLRQMDVAIAHWDESRLAAPVFPFDVSPESQTRINRGKVNFHDDQGVLRTFSDHARFTPGAGRIHYILTSESGQPRRALIGYVGQKIAD